MLSSLGQAVCLPSLIIVIVTVGIFHGSLGTGISRVAFKHVDNGIDRAHDVVCFGLQYKYNTFLLFRKIYLRIIPLFSVLLTKIGGHLFYPFLSKCSNLLGRATDNGTSDLIVDLYTDESSVSCNCQSDSLRCHSLLPSSIALIDHVTGDRDQVAVIRTHCVLGIILYLFAAESFCPHCIANITHNRERVAVNTDEIVFLSSHNFIIFIRRTNFSETL